MLRWLIRIGASMRRSWKDNEMLRLFTGIGAFLLLITIVHHWDLIRATIAIAIHLIWLATVGDTISNVWR